jgi:hypothetical protein
MTTILYVLLFWTLISIGIYGATVLIAYIGRKYNAYKESKHGLSI